MNYQGEQHENQPAPVYVPFRVETVWRQVDPPILYEGTLRSRYRAPVVVEYLDVETGEILRAAEARKRSGFWPELHFSERGLQRQTILSGLRKEVRDFATFVLKFRNERRGITPGASTLATWYAMLHRRTPCHVRRNVAKLVNARVLAGESLAGPLFQRPGTRTTARDHLQEDVKASLLFAEMLLARSEKCTRSVPDWLIEQREEMTRIVEEVMQRVRASRAKDFQPVEYRDCATETAGGGGIYPTERLMPSDLQTCAQVRGGPGALVMRAAA